MKKIKIYTDEDVPNAIAKALKRRGYEAFTTPERNKCGTSDLEQIEYATSLQAVILTHNVHDFPKLHYEIIASGKNHTGIIVGKRYSIGETVQRVLNLASKLSAEEMKNRLEYLSDW